MRNKHCMAILPLTHNTKFLRSIRHNSPHYSLKVTCSHSESPDPEMYSTKGRRIIEHNRNVVKILQFFAMAIFYLKRNIDDM
jgi:hypothetical protein